MNPTRFPAALLFFILALSFTVNAAATTLAGISRDEFAAILESISGRIKIVSSDERFVPPEPTAEPEYRDPNFIYFGSHIIPKIADIPLNRYTNSFFEKDENGRISYIDPTVHITHGIDVSIWQEDIDWQRVASDGIDFAIIRAAYRGYTVGAISEDVNFQKNIDGAIEAGLDVGLYVFSQAITPAEAVEEAEFVLRMLDGRPAKYPIVFDWEDVGSKTARTYDMDGDLLTDCAIAFCERIKAAGYTPCVYSYLSLTYLSYDIERLTPYDFWLAQYNPVPTYYYDFTMWQYTSAGTVDGIKGNVDMNICFKKY